MTNNYSVNLGPRDYELDLETITNGAILHAATRRGLEIENNQGERPEFEDLKQDVKMFDYFEEVLPEYAAHMSNKRVVEYLAEDFSNF